MESSDIIAISTAFIALCALFTTVWQSHLTRRHNKLSVKPSLSFDENIQQNGVDVKYSVKNAGLGPAIIKVFALVIDGKKYSITTAEDVYRAFEILGIKLHEYDWSMQLFKAGSSIAVDEIFDLLSFPKCTLDVEFNQKLRDVLPRLDFHIEYECFYGNRFTMDT